MNLSAMIYPDTFIIEGGFSKVKRNPKKQVLFHTLMNRNY
jgi:hypothetical protein